MMILIVLFCNCSLVRCEHTEKEKLQKQCFDCAYTNGGDNMLCAPNAHEPEVDPNSDRLKCCKLGAQDATCYNAYSRYQCTETFKSAPQKFWSKCPRIEEEVCGDAKELLTENKHKKFKSDKWIGHNVCRYKIGNKLFTYQEPSLFYAGSNLLLKILKKGANVTIHVSNGTKVHEGKLLKED